jgi:ATP-dependent DNA ligase
MLCSPGRTLPAGNGWVLEPKWDGIRAIAPA